jgi:endonuclease III
LADGRLKPEPSIVLSRLARAYGFPRHGNPKDVFFCAVYVLLSAQTTLEQAATALADLRKRWPTPTELASARLSAIRRAVRSCGFGTTRSVKIRALARAIVSRPNALRSLRGLPDVTLEAELVALPGVGFKSARVIAAMSELGRERFAIDTHVWRIAQRIGWVAPQQTYRKPTERQADALEQRIQPRLRRHLHAALVALGRDSCRPRAPACERCTLVTLCGHGKAAAAIPRADQR